MFCSRIFLHKHILFEKITSLCNCKYSRNGKQNPIKQLNLENKILYGGLLETRKQRRKSLGQVETTKTKIEQGVEKMPTTNSKNEVPKGSRKRSIKPKLTELKTELPSKSSSLLFTEPDSIITSDKCAKSVTLRSGKSSTSNTSPNSKDVSSTCNEFVFKSTVPINEINYPLENPSKVTSCELESESVLSYGFSDPQTKYCMKFPSVSKIMDETMSVISRSMLSKWKKNMIREMGQEGFNKYFEDIKSRGHDFHSAVSNVVLGKPVGDCSEVTQNALKSLEWMLELVSKPLAVESVTAHPLLEYKGIPDCVLHFRGMPVVVDWKLSDKTKKSLKETYDAPVQICAYIGALNHDPNYNWTVNSGLVAVAYTNGDPCDVFLLSPEHCLTYWRHWLMRCDKFKARSHLHTDHIIDESVL